MPPLTPSTTLGLSTVSPRTSEKYAAAPGARTHHTPQARQSRCRACGKANCNTKVLLRRTLDGLGRQQTGVDLAQGDRERLLVDVGVDERTDVLEEALAELRVVRVDLAGTLGRVDHEAVLRVGGLEELVDRRVDDALGRGDGRGHALPSDGWEKIGRDHITRDHRTSIKTSSSRATSSTEVLTK